MTLFKDHRRLLHWEECTGIFEGMKEENGLLIASIGKISLILPLELTERLTLLAGHRISILRTDVSYEMLAIEAPEMAAPKLGKIPKAEDESVLRA